MVWGEERSAAVLVELPEQWFINAEGLAPGSTAGGEEHPMPLPPYAIAVAVAVDADVDVDVMDAAAAAVAAAGCGGMCAGWCGSSQGVGWLVTRVGVAVLGPSLGSLLDGKGEGGGG